MAIPHALRTPLPSLFKHKGWKGKQSDRFLLIGIGAVRDCAFTPLLLLFFDPRTSTCWSPLWGKLFPKTSRLNLNRHDATERNGLAKQQKRCASVSVASLQNVFEP